MKILFWSFYAVIVTKSVIRIVAICLLPMTRRGSDGYHPNLFLDEVFNDESTSPGGDNVFRQLKTVASQRVADIDYEQQIARWTRNVVDKQALGFLEM
jgi:hypothetical protein